MIDESGMNIKIEFMAQETMQQNGKVKKLLQLYASQQGVILKVTSG